MAKRIYNVQAPDGSTLSFEGPDSATPDQIRAAADRAYAARGRQQPPARPQPEVPIDPQAEEAIRRKAMENVPQPIPTPRSARFAAGPGLMGGMEAAMLPEQMGTMTPRQQEQARTVASYIPMAAATIVTPPGTAAAVVYPALAEVAGSLVRGDSMPDTIRNATLVGMTPGFKIKEAQGFFAEALKKTFSSGAQLTAATMTADTARDLARGEGLIRSTKNAWANFNPFEGGSGLAVAAMAPIAGTLRAMGGRNAYLAKESQKAQDEFRPLFDRDVEITPGMADPVSYGGMEQRLANTQGTPQAQRGIELMEEAKQAWWRGLPNAPTGPDVAAKLEPYLDQVRLYQQAQKELEQMQSNLTRLKTSADETAALASINPRAAARAAQAQEELVAAQMQVVNQQARSAFFASNAEALSPSGLTPTAVQQRFTETVDEVFKLRSDMARLRYEATGVPFNEPFISVGELQSAVRRATRNESGSYVDSLLKTIEREGGEAGVLTINQMKQLRANFGSNFNSTDQAAVDQFDRIANIAYRAITQRTNTITGRLYGPEAQKALGEVNAWWGETANLASNKSLRTIFNKQPNEDLAKNLAQNLVDGKVRTFEDYGDFISTVAEFAPDVANLGRRAMTDTLREGMFFLSTAPNGRLDIGKLYQNLSNASKYRGQGKVVPIESLGFGTAKQVRQIESTFRKIGVKTLTPEEMDEFYANPLVRAALSGSGNLAMASAPVATRIAFDRRVNEILARSAVGANVSSKDWDKAMRMIDDAQMNVNQARNRVVALQQNHPLFAHLNQPGTAIGQTLDANGVRQVTDYLTNMPTQTRVQFINAVRETDPALLRMIQGRVIADTIAGVANASAGSRTPVALDTVAVRRVFNNPVKDEANPVHLLSQVLEPGDFTRLQSRMVSFARLENWANTAGSSSLLPYDLRNVTAGAIRETADLGPGLSLWRSTLQVVYGMTDGIRYATASWMLKDPQVAAFVLTGGNTILPIQKQILLMNDKDVMAEGVVSPMLERSRQAAGRFPSADRTRVQQQIYQQGR